MRRVSIEPVERPLERSLTLPRSMLRLRLRKRNRGVMGAGRRDKGPNTV